MDATRFGLFVAEMRTDNHMTQAELATKIKVTDKAVSRWERGVSQS
ncbi:MAG: helix-turn-helix domain-containing protein [Clostridiales bacterium]|nr:helix-turn-helix domain-containing protein [Clostridiales bacterium]